MTPLKRNPASATAPSLAWLLILPSLVLTHMALFSLFSPVNAEAPTPPVALPTHVERIVFGSCVKQEKPMPIFSTVIAEQPDLVLFLGDNIYADTTDMTLMRTKYQRLAANPLFARLQATTPVLATWDDHDYGVNDGGADYPMRAESQREFLDFWQVPADSPRRDQEGIYAAHVMGGVGQRVQVILLDTRYFRSPLATGEPRVGGRYVASDDVEKTMLGEAQWAWLAEQLQQPAELRILATSIQCLPEAAGQETWSNLPRQRQRLFDLIASTKAEGVILVSGDRHWSELSVVTADVPYPLYEMTSSSFNQMHPRGTPTVNRYRAVEQTFHQENYGLIEINWKGAEPTVTMQVRDQARAVKIEKRLSLSDLRRRDQP